MKASRRLASLVFVLTLAGCASDPLKTTSNSAPTEERTGGSSDNGSSSSNYPTVTADQDKSGASSELRDPNSLLSKRSIYYDFDSYIIKETYKPMLKAHAAYLLKHKDAKLFIQGNTDERGSREYNLALGQKRAESVRQSLKLLGVSDAQLEAVSFGEEKPKNPEHDETAWSENRRSDLAYERE